VGRRQVQNCKIVTHLLLNHRQSWPQLGVARAGNCKHILLRVFVRLFLLHPASTVTRQMQALAAPRAHVTHTPIQQSSSSMQQNRVSNSNDSLHQHCALSHAHAQFHLDLRHSQISRVRRQRTRALPILLAQLLVAGLLQQPHQLFPQPPVHIGRVRRVLQLFRFLLLLRNPVFMRGFSFQRQLLPQLSCACRASLQATTSRSSSTARACATPHAPSSQACAQGSPAEEEGQRHRCRAWV